VVLPVTAHQSRTQPERKWRCWQSCRVPRFLLVLVYYPNSHVTTAHPFLADPIWVRQEKEVDLGGLGHAESDEQDPETSFTAGHVASCMFGLFPTLWRLRIMRIVLSAVDLLGKPLSR
jgi:hypothetical protein